MRAIIDFLKSLFHEATEESIMPRIRVSKMVKLPEARKPLLKVVITVGIIRPVFSSIYVISTTGTIYYFEHYNVLRGIYALVEAEEYNNLHLAVNKLMKSVNNFFKKVIYTKPPTVTIVAFSTEMEEYAVKVAILCSRYIPDEYINVYKIT